MSSGDNLCSSCCAAISSPSPARGYGDTSGGWRSSLRDYQGLYSGRICSQPSRKPLLAPRHKTPILCSCLSQVPLSASAPSHLSLGDTAIVSPSFLNLLKPSFSPLGVELATTKSLLNAASLLEYSFSHHGKYLSCPFFMTLRPRAHPQFLFKSGDADLQE